MGMFKTAWQLVVKVKIEPVDGGPVLIIFTDPSDKIRACQGGSWGFNCPPVALPEYDDVEEVPLVTSSYWITLLEVPPVFRSHRLMCMVGSTLEDMKEFDRTTWKSRIMKIKVEVEFGFVDGDITMFG
uniref:uncharacterized protein LOC105351302 n=1 Tax=Fragaria vesca subsp. vesca TaxID=101020 RepID=UPI0005C926B3|nr:PREDICTED: uncharacterized protein LOC105351302 [Fragaria vesca subsp. vesca]